MEIDYKKYYVNINKSINNGIINIKLNDQSIYYDDDSDRNVFSKIINDNIIKYDDNNNDDNNEIINLISSEYNNLDIKILNTLNNNNKYNTSIDNRYYNCSNNNNEILNSSDILKNSININNININNNSI